MTTRSDVLGRGCLWVSLAALYTLCGMKLFVAWRDGLWLDWPLGDYLPDAVVRWVFRLPEGAPRTALVWVMGQDVVYQAAAVTCCIWLLTLFGKSSARGGDEVSS
ncbi:hypothetical protein K9F62_18670 [Desulfovibrio sp. JY]|nr:hypothetical protein K9F62_18670 [Desulfovibrio sp. JY]